MTWINWLFCLLCYLTIDKWPRNPSTPVFTTGYGAGVEEEDE
jgi:hypothetical protein